MPTANVPNLPLLLPRPTITRCPTTITTKYAQPNFLAKRNDIMSLASGEYYKLPQGACFHNDLDRQVAPLSRLISCAIAFPLMDAPVDKSSEQMIVFQSI